jgi:hypothetical protein
MAASFLLLAPRIIRFRERHGRPFIAKCYRPEKKTPHLTVPGAIKMVLTLDEWEQQQAEKQR